MQKKREKIQENEKKLLQTLRGHSINTYQSNLPKYRVKSITSAQSSVTVYWPVKLKFKNLQD